MADQHPERRRADDVRVAVLEQRFDDMERANVRRFDTLDDSVSKVGARLEDTRQLMHTIRNDMQRFVAIASAGGTAFSAMMKVGTLMLTTVGALAAAVWWLWSHIQIKP